MNCDIYVVYVRLHRRVTDTIIDYTNVQQRLSRSQSKSHLISRYTCTHHKQSHHLPGESPTPTPQFCFGAVLVVEFWSYDTFAGTSTWKVHRLLFQWWQCDKQWQWHEWWRRWRRRWRHWWRRWFTFSVSEWWRRTRYAQSTQHQWVHVVCFVCWFRFTIAVCGIDKNVGFCSFTQFWTFTAMCLAIGW